MSKKLENIRKKIDLIDDKVHDLLMERAGLVGSIAEEKRKNNLQIVHPAREAMMARRLLARHHGILPFKAVIGIWRELVGAVSMLQSGFSVIVAVPEAENTAHWDMARDYFGGVVPMKKIASIPAAYAALRDGESTFAVLPWPRVDEPAPWWPFLIHQDHGNSPVRVICALPYTNDSAIDPHNDGALIVSRTEFMDSGHDHSFLGFEFSSGISRSKIIEELKNLDLEVISLNVSFGKAGSGSSEGCLYLVEVEGFISADDSKLEKIKEAFGGSCTHLYALGGYPVLPDCTHEKKK